jgi:epothilone polyketide synthase E
MLQRILTDQLSRLLQAERGRIGLCVPFNELGVDSLMGLELRSRVETATGLMISGPAMWQSPTVAGLAQCLSQLLDAGSVADSA